MPHACTEDSGCACTVHTNYAGKQGIWPGSDRSDRGFAVGVRRAQQPDRQKPENKRGPDEGELWRQAGFDGQWFDSAKERDDPLRGSFRSGLPGTVVDVHGQRLRRGDQRLPRESDRLRRVRFLAEPRRVEQPDPCMPPSEWRSLNRLQDRRLSSVTSLTRRGHSALVFRTSGRNRGATPSHREIGRARFTWRDLWP